MAAVQKHVPNVQEHVGVCAFRSTTKRKLSNMRTLCSTLRGMVITNVQQHVCAEARSTDELSMHIQCCHSMGHVMSIELDGRGRRDVPRQLQ
eukprot:CAMPEP_0119427018 /NCGR_PEP_ID=MMETSP1335-20130426/37430_1 /TAXON_ID=259385 /ORGANISM="Chrysoculter rhomboideus, Strain RCC1486" /LENGTH=91 /DNA_ID=CAMNT_0007452639 /DNA_START=90 /DNA_END=365 /DNA_ORIENTATION=+